MVGVDHVADPEGAGDGVRAPGSLQGRLERLPPGHPSSPYEADGSPRQSVPGLRDLEVRLDDEDPDAPGAALPEPAAARTRAEASGEGRTDAVTEASREPSSPDGPAGAASAETGVGQGGLLAREDAQASWQDAPAAGVGPEIAALGDGRIGPTRHDRIAAAATADEPDGPSSAMRDHSGVTASADAPRPRDLAAAQAPQAPDRQPAGGGTRESDQQGAVTPADVRAENAPEPTEELPGPESFDREAAKNETLAEVAAESGLSDPEQLMALSDAYDVVYEYPAALMVKTAQDMLPDLRSDVQENPDGKVVFVGRDGRSLAVAVHALDPGFFREHCTEAVLSRALAETAIQDLELRENREFPELADFRGAAGKVDPADTVGAYRQLTDYLHRQGTLAGEPGSHVTLVDTSYKGTVQEILAGVYPDTTFTGRYAFFASSPSDPHPGSKTGYVMHLEGAAANDGRPVQEMPRDSSLTFSNQDALAAIEETLHGPMSSPKRISGTVPDQTAARDDLAPLDGFNPRVVSPRFTDAAVRDAVMRAALGAVANRARGVIAGDNDAQNELVRSATQFRDQVRAWVTGGGTDARLGEYLDAFVRRTDKRAASQLGDVIRSAELGSQQADEAWEAFGECATAAGKDDFVARFMQRIEGKE
jgi:hypothetical protein